jgi:hypothetical protein
MFAGKDPVENAECDGCQKTRPLCYPIKFDGDPNENLFCLKCFDKQAGIKHRARKSRKPTQATIPMPVPAAK